jgi:hypothetical protein
MFFRYDELMGATTLSIKALSITTFSVITRIIVKATTFSLTKNIVSCFYGYAECRYDECHYAECRYAECRYAECRYAECCYTECRYAECLGD